MVGPRFLSTGKMIKLFEFFSLCSVSVWLFVKLENFGIVELLSSTASLICFLKSVSIFSRDTSRIAPQSRMLLILTRVSAVFILRTLFLVFVDVTSSKTSSRVIPRNNSSNNFLSAVFSVKTCKLRHLKNYSKSYSRYVGLQISSGTATKIVSSRTFFPHSSFFYLQHRCIALPFFCPERQSKHGGAFGIYKSWWSIQE